MRRIYEVDGPSVPWVRTNDGERVSLIHVLTDFESRLAALEGRCEPRPYATLSDEAVRKRLLEAEENVKNLSLALAIDGQERDAERRRKREPEQSPDAVRELVAAVRNLREQHCLGHEGAAALAECSADCGGCRVERALAALTGVCDEYRRSTVL